MVNHPNRGWRARMRADADQWLTSKHAHVLIQVPISANPVRRAEGMLNRLREAYEAGYKDGRKSKQ